MVQSAREFHTWVTGCLLESGLGKIGVVIIDSCNHPIRKAAGREGLSEQSDKLITEVAKREYQQLKDAVVRAAKAWRYAVRGPLASQALEDAVDVLMRFETNHRERLNE